MTTVEQVRAQAQEVAAGWSPGDAPDSWRLTAELFRSIATHEDLLRSLATLPADRLPALLGSAAISYLVRRDRPESLARYFPMPGERQPSLDAGFSRAAAAFITERLDDIEAECACRRYQMNEVARCTQIALGIAVTTQAATGPIGLVDLGTGAGLGLHVDRYRYLLGGEPSGPRQAALSLRCDVRGSLRPPPIALPPIAQRAGIDIAPVDLHDKAATAWLLACAPPEASALARLAAAIEVARARPAEVEAGDVTQALPGILDRFAPGRTVIVTDAYLAVFLAREDRAKLAAIMTEAGNDRPVTWLSLDPLLPLGPSGHDSVQDIPLPMPLIRQYHEQGVFAVLGARTFYRGREHARLLARAHPSGQWVQWLDDGEADAGQTTAGRSDGTSTME